MKTTTNTNTTPVTTADTSASTVATTAAVFIGKTLVGIIASAAATVITAKVLKTGESQKQYEEAIKEFTSK